MKDPEQGLIRIRIEIVSVLTETESLRTCTDAGTVKSAQLLLKINKRYYRKI